LSIFRLLFNVGVLQFHVEGSGNENACRVVAAAAQKRVSRSLTAVHRRRMSPHLSRLPVVMSLGGDGTAEAADERLLNARFMSRHKKHIVCACVSPASF